MFELFEVVHPSLGHVEVAKDAGYSTSRTIDRLPKSSHVRQTGWTTQNKAIALVSHTCNGIFHGTAPLKKKLTPILFSNGMLSFLLSFLQAGQTGRAPCNRCAAIRPLALNWHLQANSKCPPCKPKKQQIVRILFSCLGVGPTHTQTHNKYTHTLTAVPRHRSGARSEYSRTKLHRLCTHCILGRNAASARVAFERRRPVCERPLTPKPLTRRRLFFSKTRTRPLFACRLHQARHAPRRLFFSVGTRNLPDNSGVYLLLNVKNHLCVRIAKRSPTGLLQTGSCPLIQIVLAFVYLPAGSGFPLFVQRTRQRTHAPRTSASKGGRRTSSHTYVRKGSLNRSPLNLRAHSSKCGVARAHWLNDDFWFDTPCPIWALLLPFFGCPFLLLVFLLPSNNSNREPTLLLSCLFVAACLLPLACCTRESKLFVLGKGRVI